MSELLTVQDMTGGHLDTQTLKEAVNEDKWVTSRLGKEYASVPMASRLLVENGLLGATPFSTYAKMTAPDVDPPLVDGDYAVVTNEVDTKKNGVYKKIDGAWVYSQYNPMSYTDKANDMRVSADSAQIAATADLLEPASENSQFEVLNGNKQILLIESDKIYADFYTKDGIKLENADISAVQTVYDLYSVGDTSAEDNLEVYDGDKFIANLLSEDTRSGSIASANETVFYIDGEQLKYADSKSSFVVDTTAKPLNTALFTPKSCLAVTSNQWFETGQSVVTMGANGCQYPNPNKVLVVVPTYGQSLSIGTQGAPPISLVNPRPNYALQFNGVNVRLDSSGTLGQTPLTDFSKVTDFEPTAVKVDSNDQANDLSREIFSVAFAQKVADVLAVENDAPMRLLSFAAGVGGTPLDLDDFPQYEQEGLGLKKGSNAYANLINAITKAKALAASKGWSVVVPSILWQHGEADASNANYAMRVAQLISDVNADIKAITAQTQDVYFYALLKANHNRNGTVGLEQSLSLANTNPLFKIVGSTYPAEPSTWDDDYTHRSARGYNYMGYMYAKAFYQELKRGFGSFQGLTFKSATIAAKVISIKLNVPVAPIKYKANDVVIADPKWGFRVLQNDVVLDIASVAISSADTVSITLVNTPSSGELVIECAMYGQDGTLSLSGIPRSNITDSDISFGASAGGDSTENWLVPFKTIITV